ncbi:MAG TPA: hypothetical protein PLF01_00835 [Alphaproteobacteria bacterium]|nr:hypothetical protein [Alphaproteobacteria bacterium]
MGKLALAIWIMAAPTLMGCLVIITLVVPYFSANEKIWIPAAAAAGAVLAIPISIVVARSIKKLTRS